MNIYQKLNKIQTELKAPKSQYNSFGKYKYRNCEDILEALKPLLKETQTALTITDQIVMIGDRFYIEATATLYDCESEQGMSISNKALAREEATKKGMDGSQVTGASSSYARKYALNGLFAIDDTKDADSDETPKESARQNTKVKGINMDVEMVDGVPFDNNMTEQHTNIILKACANAKLPNGGSAEEFWKKRYGVRSISEIPDGEFEFILTGMKCDRHGNYIG